LTLPSNNKKIKYRPFLVREEKILILALETRDQNQITNAVKDVLKKCVITRGIKIDDLPTFDIEYLFLNIRAKSIGEDINMIVTCPDDRKTEVDVTVYVDEIKVIKSKEHVKDITLDKDMTLRMKYPSLNQFIETNFDTEEESQTTVDKTFQLIADCMDTVYTKEDAWDSKDYSPNERLEFIEQLSSKQFKQVEKFFATMPKLSHTIEVTNPNTKKKSKIVLEGLADFFG
jgi:secreted Zn-dependent insulinase-like peptidase